MKKKEKKKMSVRVKQSLGLPQKEKRKKMISIETLQEYYMPGEWHPHKRCWMLWPYRPDNWRAQGVPARGAFLQVAKAISKFEPVVIGVPVAELANAQTMLTDLKMNSPPFKHPIELINIESDDSWMRDMGPTFVIPRQQTANAPQKIVGIDWIFNAWGEMYTPWTDDDAVALQVTQYSETYRIRADFVLEGGAIHVDGEGTVLTTEECLLNPNRNPSLTKEQIEEKLLAYLGAQKVLWLPHGLAADEDTNGHIDNICCFTKPGQVLLSWTDDEADDQYHRCREAMKVFETTRDARDRLIEVVKLPIPPPMYYLEEDFEGLVVEDGYGREKDSRLAASYANFYIANKGIVCPSFHPETDAIAKEILQKCFPNYEIVQVPGRDILLGGGNVHCITQQEPVI
jgi:agmatine deiminase